MAYHQFSPPVQTDCVLWASKSSFCLTFYLILILKAFSISGNSEGQDAHRANFVRLVNAHFVERCPTAQPVLEPVPKSASNRRRGAKVSIKQYLTIICIYCLCGILFGWLSIVLLLLFKL